MSFVDFTDLEAIKSNIKENTKIFYTEIIANPLTDVVDLEKIAELAKENGVLTVVDSTLPLFNQTSDIGSRYCYS